MTEPTPPPPIPPATASSATPLISVVVPAYNESGRLPRTLDQILAYLQTHFESWEVIVSDDGSRDSTPDLVERNYPQCRLLRAERNQGKGEAVRRGMLAARGRVRLFSDADLSTPIDELEAMLAALDGGGHDIVIASRALPGSRLIVRQPWWREWSGRLFNRIVQPLSGLNFHDTQCGFKLFSARAAEVIFPRQLAAGWAFDVELLILAQLYGLSVLEHPVKWINSDASRINMLRDAPRMIRDILIFRWRRFMGIYTAETSQPQLDGRNTHH